MAMIPSVDANSDDDADARRALDGLTATIRAAWGKRFEGEASFGSHLATVVAKDSSPVAALRRLNGPDLYLAFAALRGRDWAVRSLRDEPLAIAIAAVRRRYRDDSLLEECKQRVLETILVGDNAALRRYAGQASLSWWLRVIALRTASRLSRDRGPVAESLGDRVADGDDELLSALKSNYRALFRRSFADAAAGLSIHDRLLLKQHALDGVTIDEIAAARDVHRATAARWLAKIRQRLREDTCQRMAAELGLESAEAEEIIELVQSHLDASISRLLATKSSK